MNRWNEESVCLPIETIETIHDTFKPAILLLIQWWWNNLLLFYTSYSYYLTLIRPIDKWVVMTRADDLCMSDKQLFADAFD